MTEQKMSPRAIEARGAASITSRTSISTFRWESSCIAGDGFGKSSLALGVLYARGSRHTEALSTYTRRRLTQAEHAQVDEVLHVPAALALHQRPSVPGVRSTFGTMTELNNSLRLLFSRCAHHVCPHCGARVEPSLNVAAGLSLTCPTCGREFYAPSAEDLAFNSGGACPTLRRHRCHARGRRGEPGARRVKDHQRGCGASLGHAHVGPDEAGGRRDGRAHRRAV
ncbi:MAG: hypothetical protein ACLS3M_10580 [Collinsella sp.]